MDAIGAAPHTSHQGCHPLVHNSPKAVNEFYCLLENELSVRPAWKSVQRSVQRCVQAAKERSPSDLSARLAFVWAGHIFYHGVVRYYWNVFRTKCMVKIFLQLETRSRWDNKTKSSEISIYLIEVSVNNIIAEILLIEGFVYSCYYRFH